MRVWIVNQYAYTPEHGSGTRHWSLARRLVNLGHEVTIISASRIHGSGSETRSMTGAVYRREIVDGVTFVWIRTPAYSGNSPARLWNMLVFAWHVWRRQGFRDAPPPDVIVGSSPQLFAAWAAYRTAQRLRAPFTLEIRDLWPESLVSLGKISRWHPLVVVFGWIERHLYRSADRILTLLPGSAEYIAAHGGVRDKIDWLPNGIDLSMAPEPQPLTAKEKFTLVYAGSHGAANGLDLVLDAAKHLRDSPRAGYYQILLVGDGPEKARLERRASDEQVRGVKFLPPVSKNRVYEILASADACLMLLEDSPVFRWGISPNKLFDYLACARPVLFSVSTSLNPIDDAHAGITVRPGDAEALAEGIERLAATSTDDLRAMGERGRAFVKSCHDMRSLGQQLEQSLIAAIQHGDHRFSGATFYRRRIKPISDRLAAGAGLLLLAPLLVVIALAVRFTLGSPVMFRQVRAGQGGKTFQLLKFRTMTDRLDASGRTREESERLTTFGRWLRSTSLDELPQLWNVLRGDMSLVGPRPLLPEYLPLYSQRQHRRHEVKPGLTGLAQVNGRNSIAWPARLEFDVAYVEQLSFTLDVSILLKSLRCVLQRQGINARADSTMPQFTGQTTLDSTSQAA